MGDLIGAWFERDVVRATGPDAARFLQGQVSQEVEGLAAGESRWSLLLDPTGKLVVWMRVTRTGAEEFLLDVAPGWAEAMLARLNRFKIRVSCDFEQLVGWRMFSVRGGAADEAVRSAPGTVVAPAPASSVGAVGYDLLGVDPVEPDGVVIDADGLEAFRIAHGIPEMGAELDDSVIAAEMGVWFVEESVSWTKGCYTGQELVARVDSRGSNTPRRLRSVELTAPAAPGAELTVDGAVVGVLTSVFGTTALARVGRAVVPPATVDVGGSPATVTSIPGTEPPPAVATDAAPPLAALRRRPLRRGGWGTTP